MARRSFVLVSVAALAAAAFTGGAAHAQRADHGRSTATTLDCPTAVIGVLPSGRVLTRYLQNARVLADKKSTTVLPFTPESMHGYGSEPTEGGHVSSMLVFAPGRPALRVDKTVLWDSPTFAMRVKERYRPTPPIRLAAQSGRYYTYGLDAEGNLRRWTRFSDDQGHLWIADGKLVARGMGGLRTLSYSLTAYLGPTEVRTDVLYGTTRAGALKQFQVPWNTPGKPRVTTVRTSGFADTTGLSLTWCNPSGTIASIIAIERGNNQARWWTLTSQYNPKTSNLTRRQLVGRGLEWRLKATL